MREIKFKLYDKLLKKFIESYEFCIDGRGCVYLIGSLKPEEPEGRHLNVSRDRFIVSQYTGLKDKNGKEIYFDDFVSDGRNIYLVEMVNDVALEPFVSWCLPSEVSIIGNKHETPELKTRREHAIHINQL
jgi:hypothetical protein